MAKPVVKKATVKLMRSIYINGSVVPATQEVKGKDPVQTVIDVPASLAAELIANSKAVLAEKGDKANFTIAEPAEEDDFADV